MTEQQPPSRQPTEEELRAAYEAELKRIRVEDVLVQTLVSLLNLGGRKAGLAPGTEDERDLEQVRKAIDGVRALLPLVEAELGPDAGQLREALSQLQMAYARLSGQQPEEGGGEGGGGEGGGQERPEPSEKEGPGPAQQSGRLWVPGQ
jgi:hypothetical protein